MTKEQQQEVDVRMVEVRMAEESHKKILHELNIMESIVEAARARVQAAWHNYYLLSSESEMTRLRDEMSARR